MIFLLKNDDFLLKNVGLTTAEENHRWDYLHATVVCSVDPCAAAVPCLLGHATNPTCCVENLDSIPCVAVFRDHASTLV